MWIEIFFRRSSFAGTQKVTPFTGVWIEMMMESSKSITMSVVTPFTGVWIEIMPTRAKAPWVTGHSLHGSVD